MFKICFIKLHTFRLPWAVQNITDYLTVYFYSVFNSVIVNIKPSYHILVSNNVFIVFLEI